MQRVIGLGILLTSVQLAIAADHHVISITSGGWVYRPAVSETTGFLGFLATLEDSERAIGNNITLIYFDRSDNGTWNAEAFLHDDAGAAMLYLRENHEDDTIFSQDPNAIAVIKSAAPDLLALGTEAMANGFLASDPLSAQAAEQPEQVLASVPLLEALGHEVAPIITGREVQAFTLSAPGNVPLLNDLYTHFTAVSADMDFIEDDSARLFCKCTTTVTNLQSTDWYYDHSTPIGGHRKRCYYIRVRSWDEVQSGVKGVLCNVACSGTTSHTDTAKTDIDVDQDADCPPTPNY